jgi:hypothetical protein
MITRFDHAVIAVGDLDQAIGAYRELGFEVVPGGRHENRGTHNALVRFGADYLELLAVHDPEKARESGPNGQALAEFTRERRGGLVGYALATDDVESEAARLREAGLELVGPFAMRRERPDGGALTWRLLVPVDVPWRRRWPFFIQWDEPDEVRLSVNETGTHPNGVCSVVGVSVVVNDLDEASELYSILFASEPFRRDALARLGARRASFDLDGFCVELLAASGEGPVKEMLDEIGEGPFEVRLKVADLDVAKKRLASAGTSRRDGDSLEISRKAALGARLILVDASWEPSR